MSQKIWIGGREEDGAEFRKWKLTEILYIGFARMKFHFRSTAGLLVGSGCGDLKDSPRGN